MNFLFIFLLSLILTGVLRRYALHKNVMDLPNARSSHSVPTPRGGGLAVVISFSLALAALCFYAQVPLLLGTGLLGAGLMVALIGFLDDHGHVNARWRLLVHCVAAMTVVWLVNGLPPLKLFGTEIDFGVMGWVLATIAVIWLLNLYNFMDGIDGIAGFEALSACLCVAFLAIEVNAQPWLVDLHFYLAAAVAGFLLWNHPPARIFMGDAGSGFIGFILACFALISSWQNADLLWCWLIMLGVFIVDATYTLIVRLYRGKPFYQAHRSHAYQHGAQIFGKHWKVSYMVLLINLFWLLPWSWLVVKYAVDGAVALTLAYVPLIYVAHYYDAGQDKS